jgi:hypothetical protein
MGPGGPPEEFLVTPDASAFAVLLPLGELDFAIQSDDALQEPFDLI